MHEGDTTGFVQHGKTVMRLPFSGHSFLVRFLILGTIALFFGRGVGVVSAEIIHQVRFAQDAKIIVWEGQSAPMVAQAVRVSSNPYQQVPAPLAGRLEPILASVPAGSLTTTQKTFRVASNAAFAIRAETSNRPDNGDTPIRFEITGIGPNAQHPGAIGANTSNLTFADLSTPQVIYQSNRRTALHRGTVASQAVEFTASWPETEAVTVTFTVFIP